ncbi:3-ketoacyl-(acyl-carrier-protein) reductase [Paucilactobacillus oligofermentans DSM 15707 = LMG 22743]|uniref:3-ketoacyl-(Acyl-carrier-protein) reductase n=1 Tax=Paucilactobacillus oligofermentans DSM 15707 = LMG 22743 TaxID=1423778 RepID=A0A0R1RKF5_9LACO|nr:3-oxoacyl-ACP reductase [Paucilactobacillus oligofermentans]KRL54677.1 3-ketoacyl-(acyl-carrier-protein) reductase [Paucilactobacillus oligofermentans DSM 15707 = LMG 22743]CUS26413.1 Putative dehydrogenease [Paucilactobacillus oligofermentans DSM 15707 = LMG 22743]
MMFDDLNGKRAIITGAGSGIGLAQVKALLNEGVRVVAIDINVSDELKQQSQNQLTIIQADLANENELVKAADHALSLLNGCDLLLNTAGILDNYITTLGTTVELWDKVMNTNLKSQFLMVNHVLPSMLQVKHGVILNMASIAGLVAGGGGAAYTASKHAIIGYTKQLDYDYAAQGIRANCIAPGAIKTPMNAADFTGDGLMAKQVAAETPAKRWAEPEEVANLSLYLLSSVSDYVHGTVVPIDGGWIEK